MKEIEISSEENMSHYPQFIPLGSLHGVNASPEKLFSKGNEIRTIKDLPQRLFGAALFPEHFRIKQVNFLEHMRGYRAQWDCHWKSTRPIPLSVWVGWHEDKGWTLTIESDSKQILHAEEHRKDLDFSTFLMAHLWDFMSWTEKKPDLGDLPVSYVTSPASFSPDPIISEGNVLEIVIPICALRLAGAVKCFGKMIKEASFADDVSGTVTFSRCLLHVPASEGIASQWVKTNFKTTCVPCEEFAHTGKDGMMEVPRFTYVMRIRTIFNQVPTVLKFLRPFLSTTFEYRTFVVSASLIGRAKHIRLMQPDHRAVDWYFDDPWQTVMPEASFGSLKKERTIAFADLREAYEASRNQIIALLGDDSDLPRSYDEENEAEHLDDSEESNKAKHTSTESNADNLVYFDLKTDFESIENLPLDNDLRKLLTQTKLRVFYTNAILNPFGPTFMVIFAKENEIGPGRMANVYFASLHPMEPEFKNIGTVRFGSQWTKLWTEENAVSLADALYGTSPSLITPAKWLPRAFRKTLLRTLYSRSQQTPRNLQEVTLHPKDIFARFDDGLDQFLGKKNPDAGETDFDTAVNQYTELSLDDDFQEREMQNFFINWKTCEQDFYNGQTAMPSQTLITFYLSALRPSLTGEM